MANILGATFVVVMFALLAHFIGLVRWTGDVVIKSRDAAAVMSNPKLNDLAKERAVQAAAKEMFKLLGLLLLGSLVALGAPLGLIWMADLLGLLSFDEVMVMMLRWEFLLVATVIGFAIFFALRKLRQ